VGRRLGPITVLVNNAAHDQRHKFEDVTVEYWDVRQATNLRHQFFAIQAVAPMMRAAGGGSIINFGSVSWHTSQGAMPAYTTAKAAVEGLSRGMARDLGGDRIRVNTVIPGWIMTERQIKLWLTPEAEANLIQSQCLKDKLVPADVTRMVLWLASDDSRMCTAQLWIVDAGRV
jgi:NAD(P)-dependent dehydrogenase (short-subunit alcohol dehydrogenase family)